MSGQRHLEPWEVTEPDQPPVANAGLAAITANFQAKGALAAGVGAGAGARSPGELCHAKPLTRPDQVWLLELNPKNLTAAGTIDTVDWRPPTGIVWRLTEVSIVFGSGTTLVQLYKSSALSAAPIFQCATSGLWEPSRCYLQPGDRLIAVSTGGGVTVYPWGGEQIRADFLATYLA